MLFVPCIGRRMHFQCIAPDWKMPSNYGWFFGFLTCITRPGPLCRGHLAPRSLMVTPGNESQRTTIKVLHLHRERPGRLRALGRPGDRIEPHNNDAVRLLKDCRSSCGDNLPGIVKFPAYYYLDYLVESGRQCTGNCRTTGMQRDQREARLLQNQPKVLLPQATLESVMGSKPATACFRRGQSNRAHPAAQPVWFNGETARTPRIPLWSAQSD